MRPHEDSPYVTGCTVQTYEECWIAPLETPIQELPPPEGKEEEFTSWQKEVLQRLDRLEDDNREQRSILGAQHKGLDMAVWSIMALVCSGILIVVLHDLLR